MGSYCGADGVDEWDEEKWQEEISKNQVKFFFKVYHCFFQVLVLVHQVFLDLMTHSFFRLSDAALLILDECHHAQVLFNHSLI